MDKKKNISIESCSCKRGLNRIPNIKILNLIKFKAFADKKLNVTILTISLFGGVENTVGKGENAVYQHFLLFSQCFSKGWDCVVKS